MQSYGEFVLTGYYTGGRASALFYGVDTNSIQFDSKEKDMDVAINASYEWKNKKPTAPSDTIHSASGNLSIGTKRENSENNNQTKFLPHYHIPSKLLVERMVTAFQLPPMILRTILLI